MSFDPEVYNRKSEKFDPSKIRLHIDEPGGTRLLKDITLADLNDVMDELYNALSGNPNAGYPKPNWDIGPCSTSSGLVFMVPADGGAGRDFDFRSWGSTFRTRAFELSVRTTVPAEALRRLLDKARGVAE